MKVLLLICAIVVGAYNEKRKDHGSLSQDVTSVTNITKNQNGRIINGNPAMEGDFPWQVGIFHVLNGNNNQFCGGSLLSADFILTAGHCIFGATNIRVILGAIRAYGDQSNKIWMNGNGVYHPNYSNPANLNNDVAIVKLERSVNFNQYIYPIRMAPTGSYLEGDQAVRVSGWGKTSDEQNEIVDQLNWVELVTISNAECKQYYISELIQNNVVCCNGRSHQSTCNGDSGGPLIQLVNGQWYVVGVVSFVSTSGCDKGMPSGFARVTSFLDFIEDETGLTPENQWQRNGLA